MKAGMWVLGLVVAGIVAGLIWYAVGGREASELRGVQGGAAAIVPTGEPAQGVEGIPVTGEVFDGEVGTAVLSAVAPYMGSGEATRVWDGTTFTHTVTANIGAPAAGKFYEGWLVIKTPSGPKFFSTGKLTAKHGAYVLTYTAAQDYPDHKDVVVTEEMETAGLDGKPEAHVLEGAFE